MSMTGERMYSLQTRIDDELKAKLEEAAKANCRNLSGEAYWRLKASFENEKTITTKEG